MTDNNITLGTDAQLTAVALLEASLEFDQERVRELFNGSEAPEVVVWCVMALAGSIVSRLPDPALFLREQRAGVLARAVGDGQ